MFAIVTTILILIYFLGSGYAAISTISRGFDKNIKLLISPMLGVSLNILILFILSRIGFAIKEIYIYVFLFFTLLFFVQAIRLRGGNQIVSQNTKYYFYVLILLLIPILPFSTSFLQFDFNWVAFVNGDFSFYSLASTRFQNYGYTELPISKNIYDISDYSLAYWSFANEMGHRAGSEIILAYVSLLAALNAHQIFMPLTVSLYASSVMVAGAFIYKIFNNIKYSVAFMALLAFSPINSLPVYLQLIAQILGVGHLLISILLLVFVIKESSIRNVILLAVPVASFAIVYSEILPFLGLFAIVYMFVNYRHLTKNHQNISIKLIIFFFLIALMLNTHLPEIYKFIKLVYFTSQSSQNMTVVGGQVVLFPAFLTPSIFSISLGLQPYGVLSNNWLIAASMILFAILLSFIFVNLKKLDSSIFIMFLVFLCVGVFLFFKNHAYGVFKIAMLIQPFLLMLVFQLLLGLAREAVSYCIFAVVFTLFAFNQNENRSRFDADIGLSPVPFASSGKYIELLTNFKDKLQRSGVDYVLSDTNTRELALMQSYYFKGIKYIPISFGADISSKHKDKFQVNEKNIFNFSNAKEASFNQFYLSDEDKNKTYLILSPKEGSVLNRSVVKGGYKLYLSSFSETKNILIFKQTSLSISTIGDKRAFFQLERDHMFPTDVFAAIGRYHLYEIYGYAPRSKVLLDVTASYNKNANYKLPNIKVVGGKDNILKLVGKGSARIVSDEIEPKIINGNQFIGFDFGYDGSYFQNTDISMMKIFNSQLLQDPRKISLFARNISLIDQDIEKKIQLNAPSHISNFPNDLKNENLIYSGIFEDGWVSDEFYVQLSKKDASRVVIKGIIPNIGNKDFVSEMEVSIDGAPSLAQKQGIGEFELRIPIGNSDNEAHTVHLKCSNIQTISRVDPRQVSFLIKEVSLY